MRRRLKFFLAGLALLLAGCGATEATRRSLHYDGEALKSVDSHLAAIETNPASPVEVVSEAKAARAEVTNVRVSIPLIQSEIGEPDPKTTPPYTPEEHAKTNAEAKAEIEAKAGFIDSIWNFLGTTAGKITAGLGLGTIGLTVFAWLRTASSASKLWTYAKLAGSIFEKSQELKEQMSAKAIAKGVPKIIDDVVQSLPVTPASTPPPT